MVAMKAQGIDPNTVETILFTHFHGDHFGGLPYFMLDAQFFSKRRTPLTIAGPEGLADWYKRVMEMTFPGSSSTQTKFELKLIELTPGIVTNLNGLAVHTARVRHGPPNGPFHAYRIAVDDKVLAYTGDTEWVDDLIDIGRHADLFIAEAYFREKKVPLHLDLATLEANLPKIEPKRLILTHMNDDVIDHLSELVHEAAEDGLVVSL